MASRYYQDLLKRFSEGKKSLAILIDPDKFSLLKAEKFIERIPDETTHFFVGGSIITNGNTRDTVYRLKSISKLPVFLFPGDYTQIAPDADALLFLSLLSGRNAEYLVGQHVKSISTLKDSNLEIIPTGYLLLDGGNKSSVEKVTKTPPMSQTDLMTIVNTSLAGQYMGAKLIYLEAGSGAKTPVNTAIIKRVKEAIDVPLIVGGGIKTEAQKNAAYEAGADLIVMGTVFENDTLYT